MSCAPYVSSAPEVVKKMLEVAEVGPTDIVYDLGCGDGRILLTSVKDFGAKKAIGYELREDLYKTTSMEIEKHGLQDRIELVNADLFTADISEATVITLYLTTSANERLRPKLKREAKVGTRIVSHDFRIEGWEPAKRENFHDHTIYLYIVPAEEPPQIGTKA